MRVVRGFFLMVAAMAVSVGAYAAEEPKEADLSAFVARVEQAVAASARQPQPPPAPSRAGAALIAVGALVAVTGMFLLPTAILWGAFTFLGGVAALSLGAVVQYGRRQ